MTLEVECGPGRAARAHPRVGKTRRADRSWKGKTPMCPPWRILSAPCAARTGIELEHPHAPEGLPGPRAPVAHARIRPLRGPAAPAPLERSYVIKAQTALLGRRPAGDAPTRPPNARVGVRETPTVLRTNGPRSSGYLSHPVIEGASVPVFTCADPDFTYVPLSPEGGCAVRARPLAG